jgi:hypothetical protein
MTGTVTTDGIGTYTITLTDNTAGWTETTQQQPNPNGDSMNVSAETVIENPGPSYPAFSELDFADVTVDGQAFDAANPSPISDSGPYTQSGLANGSFALLPNT